jgi:hypothetical protein
MSEQQPFPQVVKAAVETLYHIEQGTNKITLFAPMQSGKTDFIEYAHELFVDRYKNAIGLYVTSYNHREFLGQNHGRLEHLATGNFNLYCLTLRDKKLGIIKGKPLKDFPNNPVFIYYDESHFGDGVNQSMHNWLVANGLIPVKNVFLISVSATCFQSFNIPNSALVTFDPKLMPIYESITNKIANGDIYESEWMIKKRKHNIEFNYDNQTYRELKRMAENKETGIAIVRIPKRELALAAIEIFKKLGKRVFVREWNMSNPISNIDEYFGKCPPGWLKICVVQQKARMGNSIPTEYVKLVYEYQPKAHIANIAQSLAGRCCGHGKKDHHVKVYSHLTQLKAYSLFEQKRFDEFYTFCLEHKLKVSNRSKVESQFTEIESGSFKISKEASEQMIRTKVIEELKLKGHNYFMNNPEVRTLGEYDVDGDDFRFFNNCLSSGRNPIATRKVKNEYGHSSCLRDDLGNLNYDMVYFGYRTNRMAYKDQVVPTEKSIYHHI